MQKEEMKELAKTLGMELTYQPEVQMENIELLPSSYWHQSRMTGFGGSNEGALNGISHFSKLTDVMYEKVLGKKVPVDEASQFRFDMGHAMEWVLLKRYATANGYKFLTYKDYFVIIESNDDVTKAYPYFSKAMLNTYSFKTRDKEQAENILKDVNSKYPQAKIVEEESNDPKDVREITPEEHEAYDAQGIVCVDRRQYRHPIYSSMLGDMDGLAISPSGEKIGLECKTYGHEQKKFNPNAYATGVLGESGSVGNPEYIYQVQHYMAVENIDRFDIIACCGNNVDKDYTVTTVYRDLDFEKQICENCEAKWEQIQKLEPMDDEINEKEMARFKSTLMSGSERDIEVIELNESFKENFNKIDELIKEINDLEAQKELKESEKNKLELPIIESLNNHKAGIVYLSDEDYNIEVKYEGRMVGGFDSKKLQANLPDIYEQYKKPTKECTPNMKYKKVFKK